MPHSEIPGSTLVCNSPRLIAADHVLHRLPSPRHPPCALSSLIITLNLPKALSIPFEFLQICRLPINIQLSKTSKHHPTELQVPRMKIENQQLNTGQISSDELSMFNYKFSICEQARNGDDRVRTDGLRSASAALSQLSYIPLPKPMGLGRVELPTSRLSGVRSNHLSYRPGGVPWE